MDGRTYGGGNGGNDLGAFDNLNDDYGRNLEVILTPQILAGIDCSANGLPANCTDQLAPHLGQPLSTINRDGELPIDRPVIFKSYGYKVWDVGKHGFNLGGLFVYQSGSPWQKTRATANPNVALEDTALNTTINTFLVPRGSFDNEDLFWLNLSGAWDFPLGFKSLNGQLRAEITNVTSEQETVAVSDRTGFPLRSRRSFQQPRKYRLLGSVRF